MEFILDGPTGEDPMSISVYDANDNLIEFYTERTDVYRGEVLVTGTVKDLMVGSGVDMISQGTQSFKGVPGEWPLYLAAS